MKLWRNGVFVLMAMGAGTTATQADLTWEHTGSVRFSKMKYPLVQFKLFTNMTPQRSRFLFKYDASNALGSLPGNMNEMPPGLPGGFPPLPGGALGMERFAPLGLPVLPPSQIEDEKEPDDVMSEMPINPLMGSVTFVQRFDDGQFLGYSSFNKKYIGEPIKEVVEKTRFNPWRKLAPKLAEKEPPSFTAEQRQRLGAEVRALMSPFLKMVVKTYFRPLPEKRTFNGMSGQGYRLTMLFNVGQSQWMRVASEWWVADYLPGDETVWRLREAAYNTVGRDPKRTTSIWMNEMPWVMWEMMPEEIQQAAYTLFPRPDAAVESAEFQRAYMPLYGALTIDPPGQMAKATGPLRFELKLTRRGQESVPDRVWQAPTDYEKVPLDDILKQFEKMQDMPPLPIPLPGGPQG